MLKENLRNIIKTVLTEETKKKLLNEQAAPANVWTDLYTKLKSAVSGKLRASISLKSIGIGQKTIIVSGYSDGRKLEFFDNGDVKWWNGNQYSKGGKWLFSNEYIKNGKLSGSWLLNDKGQKISLKEALGYPSKNFGSGQPANSTIESVWKHLGELLKQYKPKNTRYFETGNVKIIVYPGEKNLEFWKNGDIGFETSNGTVTFNGGKWIASSNKDGKLSGSWLLNNKGVKINLAYGLSQAYSNFGPKITEVVKTKGYPYLQLEKSPTPELIAHVLKDADDVVDDDENYAEAAFMAIKNMDMYNRVAKELGKDPYQFVKSFMGDETSRKYYKQSIDISMEFIKQNKGNEYYKNQNKDEVNVSNYIKNCEITFTKNKPQGTEKSNPNGEVPYNMWIKSTDPLLTYTSFGAERFYKAKVPSDFGWDFNNNIYPKPKMYTQNCVIDAKKIKDYKFTNESEIRKSIKQHLIEYGEPKSDRTGSGGDFQPLKYTPKYDEFNLSVAQRTTIYYKSKDDYKKMMDFNNELIAQNSLIPKYCTKPVTMTKQQGTRGSVSTAYLSMYNLCKDFGGLWVRGSGQANYVCGCRDSNAIDLNAKIEIPNGWQLAEGNETINVLLQKKQASKNWEHVDNQTLILSLVSVATAFIPLVGPFISAGLNVYAGKLQLDAGNKGAAAMEFFFAVLPFLNKIPFVANTSRQVMQSLYRSILRGTKMGFKELRLARNIMYYDDTVTKGICEKVNEWAVQAALKEGVKNGIKETGKFVIKKVLGLKTAKDNMKKAGEVAINNILGTVPKYEDDNVLASK